MKSSFSLYMLAVSLIFVLANCNTDDYNKETTVTPEMGVPDTTHTIITDTAGMMNTDTSAALMQKQDKTTVKNRKGKVSSVMAAASNKSAPMNQDKQGYYNNVEVLPMYPGGQAALDNFVSVNLEYPEEAIDNNIEGIVTVNFAVDEAGKVSNVKIVGKPIGYGLEEAVLNAVNKMPTWTPGVIKGKNVKTYYTLPVNFKFEQ